MTNLEYAKMLISDKDNHVINDLHLEQVIKLNTKVKEIEPEKLTNGYYSLGYKQIDSILKTYNTTEEEIIPTIDLETGEIQTSEDIFYVVAKVVIWDLVKADLYEMIATDIQKWNSWTASGISETSNSTKQQLLTEAKRLRNMNGFKGMIL